MHLQSHIYKYKITCLQFIVVGLFFSCNCIISHILLTHFTQKKLRADKATFLLGDALKLPDHPELQGLKFDTVIDSASYHIFSYDKHLPIYLTSVTAMVKKGSLLVRWSLFLE